MKYNDSWLLIAKFDDDDIVVVVAVEVVLLFFNAIFPSKLCAYDKVTNGDDVVVVVVFSF